MDQARLQYAQRRYESGDRAFIDRPACSSSDPSGGSPALTPDRSETPATGSELKKGIDYRGPLQKGV
jgi:hypothetical protein